MTTKRKAEEAAGSIPAAADHWNYRVTLHTHGESEFWMIRELYYDKQDQVIGWSDNPVPLVTESHAGIREELLLFMEAAVRPAFDLDRKMWVDPWSMTLTIIEPAGTDVTEAVT
jgi:hypothetical protein